MKNNNIIYKSSFLRGDELKKGDKTLNGSPIGFTPIDCEVNWIDADKLYSVWNIAYNLGYFNTEMFTNKLLVGFKISDIVLQLYPEGFVVGELDQDGVISGGIYLFKLENGLTILWNKKVTSLKIEAFINKTYEAAKSFGCITEENNLLFEEDVCRENGQPLLNVNEIFNACLSAGPIPSDLIDEEILSGFDRPDLLNIVSISNFKFVVLKVNKDEAEKQLKDKFEKLKNSGVDLDNLDGVSLRDMMADK